LIDLIKNILSSGIWPALPITGFLLFKRGDAQPEHKAFSPLIMFALFSTIGIAVWSMPMALAAMWHVYSGAVFGLIGWGVTFFFCVKRAGGKMAAPFLPSGLDNSDWVLIMGLLVVGACYLLRPAESIIGGRDMGIYTNHGIYIAHHGRFDVPYPWENSLDSVSAGNFQGFPALYTTHPTMTVQFAHLYPVWLAQTFCSFGFQGLMRFNSIVGLLSMCIIYGLFRMMMSSKFAIGISLIVALNPGQLWLVHVTLTEILTQLVTWGGFLLFMNALKNDNRFHAGSAGLLLGISSWVRIDRDRKSVV
jgi:hypothetical protein